MNDSIKCNYTLERHLEEICKVDEEYKILNSIWLLNKKNLSKGLNLIPSSFPHYSLHDASHSLKILDNIQCILGEERIKKLEATDTFLLLMAGLTHDIGMILLYNMIENEWNKSSFIENLHWFVENGDRQLSDAANLILNIKEVSDNDSFKWALEVKNAVILVTAEIFRGKHNKISADYLMTNNQFKILANDFYSEQLPARFLNLLADVAYLHGADFSEIFEKLHPYSNGLKGDLIHPRFIACMVRLGDLLDFDDGRFNDFSIAQIKEMPETSMLHKQKHAAVRHLLISPFAIEAELDCETEDIYRVARSWFDMLEQEVNDQSREWTNIAPHHLGGLPPVISKDSIKILYKGVKTKTELMNLKFTISNRKIFGLLEGGAIYSNPGFDFIREIIQNAYDASKIQLWKDLQDGIYTSFQEKKNDDIKFPDDIDLKIYQQYPINLSIKWKDKEENVLTIICEDRGTGISEDALLRMTNNVGESHGNDDDYNEFVKSLPFWLKPTAAFGIGLQSVFLVARSFIMETHYPGETPKQIIFRSASRDNYCSITEKQISAKRGTRVIVEIEKEKFSEIFGTSFNFNILAKVDPLAEKNNNGYLLKIDNYVYETFCQVENFIFNYTSEFEDDNFSAVTNGNNVEYELKEIDSTINDIDKFRLYENENDGSYKVIENIKGSIFIVNFIDRFMNCSGSSKLLLRDVPIKTFKGHYHQTYYMNYSWNLLNQESDKIVDLSREKLIPKGSAFVTNNLLHTFIPKIIDIVGKQLERKLEVTDSNNNQLQRQFFHLCLTSLTIKPDIKNIKQLNNLLLETSLVSDKDGGEICANKFLQSKEFFIMKSFNPDISPDYNKPISINDQQKIIDSFREIINHKDIPIIWNNNYFYSALQCYYKCTEIIRKDNNQLLKIVKISDKIPVLVECKPNSLNKLIQQLNNSCTIGSRIFIYGLKKYEKIVTRNCYIGGFENFPEYSNCCIFSPFRNNKDILELRNVVKTCSNYERIRDLVKSKIKIYITPSFLKIIRKYNIAEDKSSITDDCIYDTYTELIADFLYSQKTL